MKLLYESPFNSWDESAEAIAVYELEEGEFGALRDKYDDEDGVINAGQMLEDMGFCSEWGCVTPGARYTQYFLETLTVHHLVISRLDALNV